MEKIGFDNQKYLTIQSEMIQKRITEFGGKLYLEFGGKLFDDYHASRVLPGFQPDSKIRMLQQLKNDVEIVIAINAADIEKNKTRGDLGITYDDDVLRLIDIFRGLDLYVGSVVLTRYNGQAAANATTPSPAIPPTCRISSATRALAKTTTLRPAILWWWSQRPARAAAKWPPVFLSYITTTSAASPQDTQNLRPSPSGTCP